MKSKFWKLDNNLRMNERKQGHDQSVSTQILQSLNNENFRAKSRLIGNLSGFFPTSNPREAMRPLQVKVGLRLWQILNELNYGRLIRNHSVLILRVGTQDSTFSSHQQ